jgi:hypothetical protein
MLAPCRIPVVAFKAQSEIVPIGFEPMHKGFSDRGDGGL